MSKKLIKYEVEKGLFVKDCPHKETKNDRIIKVGSYDCANCEYCLNDDSENELITCNHENNEISDTAKKYDSKKTLEELESLVRIWAKDKNLQSKSKSPVQAMKIMEELGETMRAWIKGNESDLKDGIGDVIVTLIIFALQNGTSITECLNVAWNEIKDRTGKIADNGSFIKD